MKEISDIINSFPYDKLHNTLEFLFNSVHNIYHSIIPMKFHNLFLEVSGISLLTGSLITKSTQKLLKNKKYLQTVEKVGKYGIPLATGLLASIDSNFKDWIYNNPMENVGLVSLYISGLLAVNSNEKKRIKKEYIEKEREEFLQEVHLKNYKTIDDNTIQLSEYKTENSKITTGIYDGGYLIFIKNKLKNEAYIGHLNSFNSFDYEKQEELSVNKEISKISNEIKKNEKNLNYLRGFIVPLKKEKTSNLVGGAYILKDLFEKNKIDLNVKFTKSGKAILGFNPELNKKLYFEL